MADANCFFTNSKIQWRLTTKTIGLKSILILAICESNVYSISNNEHDGFTGQIGSKIDHFKLHNISGFAEQLDFDFWVTQKRVLYKFRIKRKAEVSAGAGVEVDDSIIGLCRRHLAVFIYAIMYRFLLTTPRY